jgi:hypothetical protein
MKNAAITAIPYSPTAALSDAGCAWINRSMVMGGAGGSQNEGWSTI